ncbi:MAG: hypothetical protein J5794_05650 [Lachnospiraceae bacterium]|nr:hypothetical protein [Lachnospiraceae bacterium]
MSFHWSDADPMLITSSANIQSMEVNSYLRDLVSRVRKLEKQVEALEEEVERLKRREKQ